MDGTSESPNDSSPTSRRRASRGWQRYAPSLIAVVVAAGGLGLSLIAIPLWGIPFAIDLVGLCLALLARAWARRPENAGETLATSAAFLSGAALLPAVVSAITHISGVR